MARKHEQVEQDFQDAINYLRGRGQLPAVFGNDWRACLKHTHRLCYSLMWWRFQIRSSQPYQRVFLNEIAADMVQILPQSMLGFDKTVYSLLRSTIENAIRHIYFFHHPIEYERLLSDADWYLPIRDHFAYLKDHPTFCSIESMYDGVSRAKSLYAELSRVQHGFSLSSLGLRPSLAEIRPSPGQSKEHLKYLMRTAESCNYLLAVFHRDVFSKLPAGDQRLITDTFSKTARRVLKGIV
ncbi:MAG: hypothetical protein IT365_18095 [Candidatus Hydrogenedentes bacterium]|nr:hypothetical protein [Candidatus Hydrogenedentota bacterium]